MSKRVKGALLDVHVPPILGIFLTVFIDLLGFGLVIPDLQLRGREFGAVGIWLGIALGSYSLAQLVTAPILGRISDHQGRRTVLLISTLLSIGAYVVYAHVASLGWIIVSRVLSGVAAANVGVAFAYVADVTTPENRAKGMGTVGAAFGLGFIFGPILGVFLLQIGDNKPLLLGYTAAALSLINFLYVLLLLPDSARHETEAGGHYLSNFKRAFKAPGLATMLVMTFAAQFGFTNLESTFFQLLADKHWIFALPDQGGGPLDNARGVGGLILGLVGIVGVFTQGFLVRVLTPKVGEVRLLRAAYFGMVPAIALIPFLPLWAPMILIGVVLLAICTGLAQPSLSSVISRTAPRDMQGGIFGVTLSLGALARFLGPLISNPLFEWRPYSPYLLGAVILVVPAALAWGLRQPPKPQPA